MVLADKAPEEMTNNAISDAISPYEHRDIDSNVSKWIPNAAMILTGAALPTDYKFNYPGHRRFFAGHSSCCATVALWQGPPRPAPSR